MADPPFRFYRPHERLVPYLNSYLFADLPAGAPVDDLIYPEWAHIRLVLSGDWTVRLGNTVVTSATTPAIIYGLTSRAIRLSVVPPTRTVSIGISPLGWMHLIRLSAARFADRLAPLSEVFPDAADTLRRTLTDAPDDDAKRAVLDTFFLSLEAARPEPSPLLLRAHELILDPSIRTAEDLAAGLGRSSRHVARLSLEMFGFSPKLLLRRQRFMRSLAMVRTDTGRSWTSQIDAAYYDQSHFVRDFHRFMGMSPSRYYALPRRLAGPAAETRQRQIGVAHQGFDALPKASTTKP